MTFSRVNAIGWAQYELLTAAQMNALDINVSRALDGYAGGVYAPSVGLVLDGGSIATGYTLETRATTVNAGFRAVQSAAEEALEVHALAAVSQASQPVTAVWFEGTDNAAGAGGNAMLVQAGAGGPSGVGGVGLVITGGAGTTGQGGGAGIVAVGGAKRAEGSAPYSLSHGIYALGGAAAGVNMVGAPGAFGLGGASVSGIGGPGGFFQGNLGKTSGYHGVGLVGLGYGAPSGWGVDRAAGVAGHGGDDNFAGYGGMGGRFQGGYGTAGGWGVYSRGGTGAVVSNGGGGGYFEGAQDGVGVKAIGGSSGMLAVDLEGGIDFDQGSSIRKNPPVGQFMSNKLYAKSIVKAWGIVDDGVLVDGFNVESVAVHGTYSHHLVVTLSAEMASTEYAVICSPIGGMGSNTPRLYAPLHPTPVIGDNRTTSTFVIEQYGALSGNSVDWAVSSMCYFMVLGEQS